MSAKKKNRPRRREAGKAKIKIPDQGGSIDPDIIIGGPKPDGGTLPDEILGGAFSKLDADLPLLLLPVRIETNYNLDPDPPELRIRIYPDQIHIDSDWPQHSAAEVELVKEYWIRWHIAKMDLEKQIAWAWFIGQVIPQRAVYLARIYEPTVGKDGKLIFPSPDFDAMTTPAHPVLLPHCWLAIGYGIGGAQIFLKAGQPVAPDLRTGPDPEATAVDLSGGDLNIDEGLAWMIDYDLAVEAGMAITIPLTGDALEATDKVQVLLVIGVMEDSTPQAAATELARLLEVHARTTGLAFVPQGTPTNNTATVAAGWTPQETEYPAPTERASKGSRTGPITGHPTEPSQIDYDDNAFQLARALGLSNPASLRDLPFGSEREAAQSRYMRTVLFEAVMGTLLRELLDVGTQNAIGGSAINSVRQWFVDQLTGGAPIPTVRVGSQPYGVLPLRRSQDEPDLSTTAGQVERVVGLMIDGWRLSLENVPTMDSDQTDEAGEGELETEIASILATQPHPARFFTRELEEYIAGSTPFTIQATFNFMMDTVEGLNAGGDYLKGVSEAATHYEDQVAEHYPGGFQSVDDQIDVWNRVRDRLINRYNDEVEEAGLGFVDDVLTVLERYEGRQRPLRWLGLDRFEGVLGEEPNTMLVAGALRGGMPEWENAGLVEAPDAAEGQRARDYLLDLHRRFQKRATNGELGQATVIPDPQPMLYQLLDKTLHFAPNFVQAEKNVLEALEALSELEPERLEWLLRETLGLGAHRLDAWSTSLASEKLERLRQEQPTGIQIGAFGWATQLEPRRQKRPSAGFIHTPSLAHATSAALLRAGWHAHGSDDPMSPVAVDISSERVRTASWLLEGVRQGQPLSDLLGYRFERNLHDRHADAQIRPVREFVLQAQGRPNAVPDRTVDGIALLELLRQGELKSFPAPVINALNDMEMAFDAVQDVGLFEAVHQLSGGNFDRATAMLDSLSIGAIEPPELRAPITPRSAQSVSHRVVILLHPDGEAPGSGWEAGLRDSIAPALERWVASLVPSASDVGFETMEIAPDGKTQNKVPLTLEKLGLSALDAIYLLGDDPSKTPATLQTLAAEAAGLQNAVQIDPATSTQEHSLADFAVLAIELRRQIESLRPLDARDLRPAAVRGEADVDLSPELDRIEVLTLEFDRLYDDLDDAIQNLDHDEIARLVVHSARLGLSTGASPHDEQAAGELLDLILQRQANVIAQKVDLADRQPGLEARLTALFAGKIPLMGRFDLQPAEGGSVVDVTTGPAAAHESDDWLDALGRVRAEVGKLTTIGLLSELLGNNGLQLHVGQDPLEPGEGWAAVQRPAGAGRLSIVAVSGPDGAPAAGQAACGLFVDQWSDAIPSDEQVTGVTFQFDAPSNSPSQAMLLAVTPDDTPWNLKLVCDGLLETLEWAMLRAVSPEDLVDYGRTVPTTFVPGNILNWPKEASTSSS